MENGDVSVVDVAPLVVDSNVAAFKRVVARIVE